jgi:hypothetical protein
MAQNRDSECFSLGHRPQKASSFKKDIPSYTQEDELPDPESY